MKLAAYYNRVNIVITLSVLIIGAVIYYFAINYITGKQLDGDLREETKETADFISTHKRLPGPDELEGQQTFFARTNKTSLQECFFDTVYTDDDKSEPGRAEVSLITLNGVNYRTTVIVSSLSTVTFVKVIAYITFALVLGLLVTLFLANRYLLNDLWLPFYRTLNDIKAFKIADGKAIDSQQGKVDEFNELNDTVRQMSARVRTDFQHLKQFTENASHEMLTPLAVITAKLDMLIQDETLKQEQFEQLTDIYSATGKLAKLNQTLVLLIKIENNLIADEEVIDLEGLIANKIRDFQELASSKEIELEKELTAKQIMASRYLVEILLNNLLSNAIRHNIKHGKLNILLDGDKLVVENTAEHDALDANIIFERFHKGQGSDGSGLGLAIVKNICNMYGWELYYAHSSGMHTFTVAFDTAKKKSYLQTGE
jgi:signal transduction histidine kinase